MDLFEIPVPQCAGEAYSVPCIQCEMYWRLEDGGQFFSEMFHFAACESVEHIEQRFVSHMKRVEYEIDNLVGGSLGEPRRCNVRQTWYRVRGNSPLWTGKQNV